MTATPAHRSVLEVRDVLFWDDPPYVRGPCIRCGRMFWSTMMRAPCEKCIEKRVGELMKPKPRPKRGGRTSKAEQIGCPIEDPGCYGSGCDSLKKCQRLDRIARTSP